MSHVSISASQHARLLEAERVLRALVVALITYQDHAPDVVDEQIEVLLNEAIIDRCDTCQRLLDLVCSHCAHTNGRDDDREFDLFNEERKS